MTGYASRYTYELKNEFPSIKQKTKAVEVAFQRIEAIFDLDGKEYLVQFDGYQKILEILNSKSEKIDQI